MSICVSLCIYRVIFLHLNRERRGVQLAAICSQTTRWPYIQHAAPLKFCLPVYCQSKICTHEKGKASESTSQESKTYI